MGIGGILGSLLRSSWGLEVNVEVMGMMMGRMGASSSRALSMQASSGWGERRRVWRAGMGWMGTLQSGGANDVMLVSERALWLHISPWPKLTSRLSSTSTSTVYRSASLHPLHVEVLDIPIDTLSPFSSCAHRVSAFHLYSYFETAKPLGVAYRGRYVSERSRILRFEIYKVRYERKSVAMF